MVNPKGSIVLMGENGKLGSAVVSNIVLDPELAAFYDIYTAYSPMCTRDLDAALRKAHP